MSNTISAKDTGLKSVESTKKNLSGRKRRMTSVQQGLKLLRELKEGADIINALYDLAAKVVEALQTWGFLTLVTNDHLEDLKKNHKTKVASDLTGLSYLFKRVVAITALWETLNDMTPAERTKLSLLINEKNTRDKIKEKDKYKDIVFECLDRAVKDGEMGAKEAFLKARLDLQLDLKDEVRKRIAKTKI
jgi:hypothetical protein